jgi:hypothetical protein
VDAWLDANAAGDSAAAWAVLAPQSRRAVGSYANFVSMRSALAEGWGAWASANEEPRSIDKVYDTPDGPVRTVTLFGYVSQEGPQQLRATAVLVRQLPNGRYAVSTFEDAGYVDLRMPERDGQVVPGDAVLVGTTEHESTMFFVLDRTLHRATVSSARRTPSSTTATTRRRRAASAGCTCSRWSPSGRTSRCRRPR